MIRREILDIRSAAIKSHCKRPAAGVVLCFIFGITLSQVCGNHAFSGLAAVGILAIGAAFLALRKDRLDLALILGLAAILVSGMLMALAHRDSYGASDLRSLISRSAFPLNQPVLFTGCVIRDGESRNSEILTTVQLRAFRQKETWISCSGKGILRIARPDPESAKSFNLKRGDRIHGWGTWRIPNNYENPGSADSAGLLARRGIYLTGRIKSIRLLDIVPDDCSNPWTGLAAFVAGRVRNSLEPIRSRNNGQPSAVLASLVIGDYSGLNNATRETFQNTGTFHVLVVSGLHVAWIAGVLLQILKWVRLPERMRYLLVALVILLYACVVGFQASITRCLWMFMIYLTGRVIFRRADPANILCAAALILLTVQPDWMFEIGFQLSFLAVLAIAMTAVPAIEKYWKPLWDPLRYCGMSHRLFLHPGLCHRRGRALRIRCEILIEQMVDGGISVNPSIFLFICRCFGAIAVAIGSMILTTLSVQLWIEPILACNFNRISWIAPIAAMFVVPCSSLALSAGIIASFAMDLPALGPLLTEVAGYFASLMLQTASVFASMPGAWQRCPTPSPVFVWLGILGLFVWSFSNWRRFWIPCVPVLILLACSAGPTAPGWDMLRINRSFDRQNHREATWSKNAAVLSFTFLDVGEGDSTVIRFPDQRVWVLDAGGLRNYSPFAANGRGLDTGEAIVSRYLWKGWVRRLDRLILSHTDADHAGGVPAVIKNFEIGSFYYSAACQDQIMDKIIDIAHTRRLTIHPVHEGIKERIGPVKLSILNPPTNSPLQSANENSIVIGFSFKNFSALLTGDLEKEGETRLLRHHGNQPAQLLKVAHHGSRTSTSAAFIESVRPRWGIISAGRHNPYGHPSELVLDRLRGFGTKIFSTIDEGAITFETDGTRYRISSHLNGILEQGAL